MERENSPLELGRKQNYERATKNYRVQWRQAEGKQEGSSGIGVRCLFTHDLLFENAMTKGAKCW